MIRVVCTGGVCRVVDRLPSIPIRQISNECSYQVAGYEHMQRNARSKFSKWDGYIRLFHKSHRTFPIGLLPTVQDILNEHDINHLVTHSPSTLITIDLPQIDAHYKARKYQEAAIASAMKQKIAVLRMATGAGKTVVAGHLMSRIQLPVLFLVHTKDLLYQAIDEFSNMYGARHVGQIGDGIVEIGDITVATIQTLTRIFGIKYEKYGYEDDHWDDSETDTSKSVDYVLSALDQIGVVFVDECHRVAAPTAMAVLEQLTNPKFRFGLSASPWRDDGADLAIKACLGGVAYSVTASDLINSGHLVRPTIRFVDVKPASFPHGTQYASIYKRYIVENEERNEKIVRAAASLVRRQKPTLVLVQRIKHGEILQRLISEEIGTWVPFLSGRDSGIARKEALDDIREGRSGIMIASTIADEGLDLKPLSGLILAGGGKSSVKALQRIGRTLRPFKNKTNAEIIDFNDQAKFLMHHSAARLKLYETEPEWNIIDT